MTGPHGEIRPDQPWAPTEPYPGPTYQPSAAPPSPPPPGMYAPPPYGTGYPPPYGGYPQPRSTPGSVIAAAALGYSLAGLLILGAIVLFLAAAALQSVQDALHSHGGVSAEAAIDGVLNLALAGVLIAGAVGVTTRRAWSRAVLVVANALVLADAVYWIARLHFLALAFGIFFVGAAVAGLCVALTASVRDWTAAPTTEGPGR